jgi:hypothetical protein
MDGRRSPRRSIVLPVLLSGTDFSGQAFQENTWTIGVNRHGAKISTSSRLAVGDQVMVGNPVLGHSTKARVTRVVEKGRAFEIGVELLEPKDVWGAKIPPEDWASNNASSENGAGSATPDAPPRAAQSPESGLSPKPEAEGDSGHVAASASNPSSQPAVQTDSPTGLEESAGQMALGDKTASSPESHSDSLAAFLRDSRAELNGLLARTQEIQRLSSQAVQSLLEAVHVKLHQELEAAAASFASDTHQRIQHVASAALQTFGKEVSARQTSLLDDALARSQAARQEIEQSVKQGVEECQNKLAESSGSALEEFRHKGKAFFDSSQLELQKTLDDLKTKATDDVSEHLRMAASELADEMRRRADVGFEILNEQLTRSARALIEEIQKHIAVLSQSALADLSHKASDAVQEQVSLGASALSEAAAQARAGLDAHLQRSIEAFQEQISELTKAALEKNSKTSEFLLHDLQSRLDQAARALQLRRMESAGADRERPDE